MITKRILGEKILRRIHGGDYPTSKKVDKRDVYLEMEAARNELIQKYLNSSPNDISGNFCTTYKNVLVSLDHDRERFYSLLPAQPISLDIKGNQSNSLGVRQVSGMKDEYNTFIPMNTGDASVFYGLEATSLSGGIGFWIELDKIIYENMPYYWENKEVLVKMIASVYSLGEDEFIPIPAGIELELEDAIYERLMKFRLTPKEKVADSNPNT